MNRAEKSKKAYGGGEYEDKAAKDIAGKLKKIMLGFQKGDQRMMTRY